MTSRPYRRTAIFTTATLPAGLRRAHSIRKGVWGVIRVIEGSLRYVVEDGTTRPVLLNAGDNGLIIPQQPHHVEPFGEMRMLVEFYDHQPALPLPPLVLNEEELSAPISERRAALIAKRQLDEAVIVDVVDTFYGKIRKDEVLAEIFERVIAGKWDEHLGRMYDFWSSIMLMSGRYKGNPMQKHAPMAELTPKHFERWLALFRETVETLCSQRDAQLFMEKAQMIARSLQYGIAAIKGELPSKRDIRTRLTLSPEV
ncbi:DUF1971 domain-containing protein [Rhizobium mayense]|uniref:DUF1971 domain-containing protein n=1 Tax=Rhizobium mayense TaxID=1312184 RepID=A0ABT7K4B3_9HYPH|nr:DUF1971 domain-containing protein [Rhizobium mayense]MDL2403432.1 DUF1971 domain-containing protein [Rhizobium mayense]